MTATAALLFCVHGVESGIDWKSCEGGEIALASRDAEETTRAPGARKRQQRANDCFEGCMGWAIGWAIG
jgi:hypothetical protein